MEQECKENVKDFLEYLHENPESTPNLKKLVYDVIKYFAEKNTEKFQNSNLIELTDNVVFKKRGEIFPPSQRPSVLIKTVSPHGSQKGSSGSVGFSQL